jgi:hypothetical protein
MYYYDTSWHAWDGGCNSKLCIISNTISIAADRKRARLIIWHSVNAERRLLLRVADWIDRVKWMAYDSCVSTVASEQNYIRCH